MTGLLSTSYGSDSRFNMLPRRSVTEETGLRLFPAVAAGSERLKRSFSMLVGVPKEVKTHEYRVGLTPGSVRELAHRGHEMIVEAGAGAGVGFDDATYEAAGAAVVATAAEVFATAELI